MFNFFLTDYEVPSLSPFPPLSLDVTDGIKSANNYPKLKEPMKFDMRVTLDEPGSVKWDSNWHYSSMTCPGHPNQTVIESHSDKEQNVLWTLSPLDTA